MSYRINLYRCPKEKADKIRNITNNDLEDNRDILDVLQEEEIKKDTLAYVLDTGHQIKDNLCSHFFTNKLDIEYDMDFYTISKDQFLNIIEYSRKLIYNNLMGKTVNFETKEIGDRIGGIGEKPSFDDAVKEVCNDALVDATWWGNGWDDPNGKRHWMNIDITDNKWQVSGSWKYEYCIFDFIHILKIFDWENDYLIAIGG